MFTFFSFVAQMQQLIDLVLTCKRNAENEVKREEAAAGGVTTAPGRKRRLEQEMAERALKFLKASQEPGKHSRIPGEETMCTPAATLVHLAALSCFLPLRPSSLNNSWWSFGSA